ncbi:nitroreductase family protein [Secundilactobacillus sp. HBUAS58055]|nr:nitroreductase family protein [Secundilactobacillus angelensis]MCH5461769.1 nitroreductase family protein [Secundilactobacillus angelensis]
MKALLERKSVRSYTGTPVTIEQRNQLLKAAYASPVSMGQYDTVELTVVQNPELLAQIDDTAAKRFGREKMLYGAPMLIIASTQLKGDATDNAAYSNTATIIENLNLAAVDLDLGACHIWGAIVAVAGDDGLKRSLKISEGFTPVAGLVVGQTADGYTDRDIPEGRIKTEILD